MAMTLTEEHAVNPVSAARLGRANKSFYGLTLFAAILVLVTAGFLLVSNGALVPSLDVLPYGTAGWEKRIPLFLLFALTYALTVTRYYATTTTKVQRLAPGAARAAGRAAETRPRVESGRS